VELLLPRLQHGSNIEAAMLGSVDIFVLSRPGVDPCGINSEVPNRSPCSFDLFASWDRDHLSSPLILKLILLHCPRWLVREITTNILAVGAPTAITTSHHPIEQGWMPRPVWCCHWSGGSSLYANACLGWLLCHDTGLCLLIGAGLCLLLAQWPSSYEGSSFPGEGAG
jgi:hypothetical protein